MLRKKLSLTLLSILVLQLIALSGCSPAEKAQSATQEDASDSSSAITSPAPTQPQLQDGNYEGYEFRILARDNGWDKMEVDFDNPESDVVYNAVYERNRAVEEKYNVKVTGILNAGDIYSLVKKSVLAGDNDYDLVLPSMADAARLGREGLTRSWTELSIDLSKPWYDQNIVSDMSINGKIYFMTGDMNIRDNDNAWIILFNKKLLQDFKLDSPYEMVKNGKWTIDKLNEMGKSAVSDLNGDGRYDENDRYGLITTSEGAKNFFYASGLKVVEKDKDDNMSIGLTTDYAQQVVTKISDLFNKDKVTFFNPSSWQQAEAMFAAGQSLFYGEIVTHIINLRYMETDFGVLPTPKFNEEQDKYYTHIASNGTAMCVPDTLPDPDRTSVILDALGCYGKEYLTPAFNTVALESKYSRDEESAEMLDIIWGSIRYDIGYLFNIGGMGDITTTLVSKNSADSLQSTVEKNMSKAKKDLDSLIEAYQKLG